MRPFDVDKAMRLAETHSRSECPDNWRDNFAASVTRMAMLERLVNGYVHLFRHCFLTTTRTREVAGSLSLNLNLSGLWDPLSITLKAPPAAKLYRSKDVEQAHLSLRQALPVFWSMLGQIAEFFPHMELELDEDEGATIHLADPLQAIALVEYIQKANGLYGLDDYVWTDIGTEFNPSATIQSDILRLTPVRPYASLQQAFLASCDHATWYREAAGDKWEQVYGDRTKRALPFSLRQLRMLAYRVVGMDDLPYPEFGPQ